jgi:hypothetical protein
MAWLLVIATVPVTFYNSWTAFDSARDLPYVGRPGGNLGHTLIDFGSQWLMGGMAAHGLGQHLYHRDYQRELLRQAYPERDEVPREEWPDDTPFQHEADRLFGWMMTVENPTAVRAKAAFLAPLAFRDPIGLSAAVCELRARADALKEEAASLEIGGPLYPPVHALFMYPLGLLSPAHAYRIIQAMGMIFAFVSGWGIRKLADGRIWWPIATTSVILYPGFIGMLNLGQNSIFLLTPLIWGWILMINGRPFWGGMLWAIMAFKPVWLVAFFLVPLLTRRWRFCLGMLIGGSGLALATLPVVGWHSWFEWLQIGRVASRTYSFDENWIFLSRDLLSIPRRWLFDFRNPPSPAAEFVANILGCSVLLAVLEITVRLTVTRKAENFSGRGPMAAFVLLGAWFCCYHFMYYDMLLTALPVWLLLIEPERYLRRRFLTVHDWPGWKATVEAPEYYQPRWPTLYPSQFPGRGTGLPRVWMLNSMTLTLIAMSVFSELIVPGFGISFSVSASILEEGFVPMPLKFSTSTAGTPWSLFCLLCLWLWLGWVAVRRES